MICVNKNALTNDMREIGGFLRLARRLANLFGHPSQVRTQVLVLQSCVDLRRLANSFGQDLMPISSLRKYTQCKQRNSMKYEDCEEILILMASRRCRSPAKSAY